LTLLGAVREILGTGVVFRSEDFGMSGITLQGENYGMLMFVLAPGAFLALGYLIALFNKFVIKK
jgi:electron transport complex protein RnfE